MKEIDEILKIIIEKRGFYIGTSISRKTAFRDKCLFYQGKLSYERKKIYILNAGFEIKQKELWGKK